MTTHDIHRTMEDNLFNKFQRHTPLPSSNASISSFPSLTASELIGLLPGTPHQKRQQQQRMARDRPASDILQSHIFNGSNTTKTHTTEAEAIDQWFENIQRYELMLEEVAAASLDQTFKDELQHVNQWFRCRSDAERTAALYSVVQNASQIQMRFLIMVLQQLSNQEPFGLLTSNTQDKDSMILPVAGSVISTESEYERRKRQLYSASHRRNGNNNHINNSHHHNNTNNRSSIRITSASSEPDDLRRRNRDLFSMGRSSALGTDHPPLGSTLSQQGLLYEKALAARAQLQAMHNNRNNSSSSVSSAASVAANSVNSRLQPILSATTSTPTNDTSGGLDNNSNTSSSSSNSGHSSLSLDSLQQRPPPPPHPSSSSSSSLFGNDWPFPFTRQNRDRSTLVGRIGDHRSVASSTKSSAMDDAWSFGSLSKKKKNELMELHSWTSRKSGTIKEEHESSTNSSQEDLSKLPPSSASSPLNSNKNNNNNNNILSSLHNSLSTLEQAQARLRAESTINRNWSKQNNNNNNNHSIKNNNQQQQQQQQNNSHNLLVSNHSHPGHGLTTSSSLTTAAANLSNLLSNNNNKNNSNFSPIGNPTIPTTTTQNINNNSNNNHHHKLDPKSAYTSPLPTPSLSSTTSNNNPLKTPPSTSNHHLHSTKETRSSSPLLLSPSSSSKTSMPISTSTSTLTTTPSSITPTTSTSSNVLGGSSFLVPPPTVYENEILEISHSTSTENHSDQGEDLGKEDEQPALTGTARRRKRSSAARALKDKIAAETVDFELMKDVQNWLRSLRLHKYGHAFIGLQWQQVIKMSDQDMIDAGVNTIGARRKLLKVFENVQRHCNENDIEY